MPTYRLDLAYDGSGFHGYARQPGMRTVQGELEEGLFAHTGTVDTFVAGRTDKGVHAAAQVVSFEADAGLDTERVMRSLNRRLGPEIAVLSLAVAADDFHARFSATGRRYAYRVLTGEVPDPFLARTTWHVAYSLDVAAMNEAARCFLGERDFASLCRKPPDAVTVRLVRKAEWAHRDPRLLEYDVEASSFCQQMVRSMVALCVDVGRGRVAAADVPAILEALDRHAARGVAPPHGLTLVGVTYDEP